MAEKLFVEPLRQNLKKRNENIDLNVGFSDAWWYDKYGISLSERYFNDAEYRIRLEMEKERMLYERFGNLGLGSREPAPTFSLPLSLDPIASMYGAKFEFRKETSWTIPLNFDDAAALVLKPVYDVRETEVIKEGMKQLAYMEEKYGLKWTNTSNCDGMGGVMNATLNIRGYRILTDMVEKQELARHIFVTIAQTMANFADWRCDCWGRRPPAFGVGNCSDSMISPELYLNFIFPCDEYLAAKYVSFGIHRDNKLDGFLDVYLRHPKLKSVDCGWDSDLKELRKRLPVERYHINLRLDPVWLSKSTKKEVISQVKRWEEEGGGVWTNEAGKPQAALGLIMDYIDSSVPEENIEALFEAVNGE